MTPATDTQKRTIVEFLGVIEAWRRRIDVATLTKDEADRLIIKLWPEQFGATVAQDVARVNRAVKDLLRDAGIGDTDTAVRELLERLTVVD